MTSFGAIDLSKLPTPDSLLELDYEVMLAGMVERYSAAMPELADKIQLESDSHRKLLELVAFDRLRDQASRNAQIKAVMLAFSGASDLDQLAALIPLVRRDGETDDDFRARIQLAPEGFSVAGPVGAYIFHAKQAHDDVIDVFVESHDPTRTAPSDPKPGDVHVYVLTQEPDAVAAVRTVLQSDNVRPLTDFVRVFEAQTTHYIIEAVLHVGEGPSAEVVREAAQTRLNALIQNTHRLGGAVRLSAIYGALHVEGVDRVELVSPTADIVTAETDAPFCDGTQITVEESL